MKMHNPYVEIQFRDVEATDILAVYKKLERIARLCYKSDDKITDDSYAKMLKTLNDRGHFAMLEHQAFVMEVDSQFMTELMSEFIHADWNHDEFRRALKYISLTNGCKEGQRSFVSGSTTGFKNLWKTLIGSGFNHFECLCRFIYREYPLIMQIPDKTFEMSLDEIDEHINYHELKLLSNEEIRSLPYNIRRHHDYITALMITDRGVTHEDVRHRPVAYAQESTRYCNFGKDPDVQYAMPSWFSERTQTILMNKDIPMEFLAYESLKEILTKAMSEEYGFTFEEAVWFQTNLLVEYNYQMITIATCPSTKLPAKECKCEHCEHLKGTWQPQQSRSILTNSLKTAIYNTAPLAQWEWFCKMRVPNTAHPDMRVISRPLQDQIIELVPEFPHVSYD